MSQTVLAECPSCGGTGVFRGFAEPKGVGVVCLTCNGKGCSEFTYKPFTERKRRNDVQRVQRSRGSLLVTGVGPIGNGVSYEDFLKGKMP